MTTNRGLAAIRRPADLRGLGADELASLAAEIRGFLISAVSRTGGHLGPNLGVVELTIALHRVFDSPRDTLIWDTGHQAYVHKLLTGRQDGWDRLKKTGGLSGYPSRAESEHDHVESSHASSSLSWADGVARAHAVCGRDRHVVAVIGDGALTGGMAWEALNNIAAGGGRPDTTAGGGRRDTAAGGGRRDTAAGGGRPDTAAGGGRPDTAAGGGRADTAADRNLVIVVNDNGRSYSPTIGGLADRLASLRLQPGYERMLEAGKRTVRGTPVVGPALYAGLHAFKAGVKDALSPQELFSDLGLKYFGPVDGHDIGQVESALRRAKRFGGPVIVHAVTRKGNGYPPAENDEAEQMHSPSAFDPETGEPTGAPSTGWTDVFSSEIVELGTRRSDVVAITAAMLGPTGLAPFAAAHPDRTIDVGIAEQHALATAAGLSRAGMHPVVALYSTFLNRGFDQLLMDVGLHRERVTLMLDRSGVTGSDGPSHNGMWDLSLLGIVPGMRVAAPRDAATLREEFREAVAVSDGPTALRYPKGSVIDSVPALRRLDGPAGVDVLHEGVLHEPAGGATGRADVLMVCVGAFGRLGVGAAKRLADQGVAVTVVDPRWVLPVPQELLALAADHQLVVTVSDCGTHGGFGSALSDALRAADIDVRQRDLALPQEYLVHGSRDDVLARAGLTEQDVARRVTEWAAASVPSLPALQDGERAR